MKNKKAIVEERLRNAFSPIYLEVIDDSEKHRGHAGYQDGNRHFTIIISAPKLHNLSRIHAHREIYALFCDMLPHDIHALSIKIKETP